MQHILPFALLTVTCGFSYEVHHVEVFMPVASKDLQKTRVCHTRSVNGEAGNACIRKSGAAYVCSNEGGKWEPKLAKIGWNSV